MIVSVASGKGGTGKTTIAVNLALSLKNNLKNNVKLLDCDVEAPNCHLFINPNCEKYEHTETVFMPVPEIDEKKCNLCGKCGDICQFKAIITIGDRVMTFPELCHGCGGCIAVCPELAIKEIGREIGIIQTGNYKNLAFVHGKLRIGEAMSPPLIRKVMSYGNLQDLQKNNIENVIIDAPPGTSCPVIAAIKDSDFVLLVTEPTPFGLNDLILAVEAVKILNLPKGLVINRCDIGNDDVLKYAKQENMPVLMQIPFDRKIAEIYSRGEILVEAMPEWTEKFCKLHRDIGDILESAKK